MAQLPPQLQGGGQEPVTVQLDPKCLHSALKEFFDPLRTNDPRTDFFTLYRRESGEFDRDYARKYDDLNTFLIFAGLFSVISATFVVIVQPKLEPDPNETTTAYMQILIHTMNSSLFPDVDPSSVAWAGPPPEIVTIQSLLYASLATSLLAAFFAILGKQWINRYIWNRGGSAADKSRDRQRKLDGLKNWRFCLVIETIPVMLQIALLLLGGALSRYLWTINRTVGWVILSFTLFGITSYVFFTLAAALYHNCPYQTPSSVLIRDLTNYLARSDSTFARSVQSWMTSYARLRSRSMMKLRRALRHHHPGVRSALQNLGYDSGAPEGVGHVPLAIVESPTWFSGEVFIDWKICKADTRCISWMFDSATDSDVIFCTARFAADIILYPEIAHVLSPRVLANHFLGCLSHGRVIPGKLEHASVIGMALASVLSIQLCMDPGRGDLRTLSGSIHHYADAVSESEPTFLPGVGILSVVSETPEPAWAGSFRKWDIFSNISDDLPATDKLCLSRMVLQTVWRWRRIQDPSTTVFNLGAIDLFCKGLMANGDHILPALKASCFLIMAISLGDKVDDIRTPFTHNTDIVLREAIGLFHKRLLLSIAGGNADQHALTLVLSALVHLDPFQVTDTEERGFSWITEILSSKYPEDERYRMASKVVQLLGKHFDSTDPEHPLDVQSTWIPPLVGFLSLYERFYSADSPSYPRSIALRILSTATHFSTTILPLLTLALSPTHPLQSRSSALKVFHRSMSGWFSQKENVPDGDIEKLLQAVGDPFKFTPDPPLHDGRPADAVDYDPVMVVVILIEFALSNLWRDHLRDSNFTSCEEITSTEEGRKAVLGCMVAHAWPESLCTPPNVIAAIRRLEELQCSNTAEVVIVWARTAGVMDPLGLEVGRPIQPDTSPPHQPTERGV